MIIVHFQHLKSLKDKRNRPNSVNSLHLAPKYIQIFVLGHYQPLSVAQSSQFFSEQTMSAHEYPSIFSRQMEAIVYILKSSGNVTSFQLCICVYFTSCSACSAMTYLYVQLKFVEVESIPDTNVSKAYSDSYFLPFKLTSDVKNSRWPYDHLCNFTECVATTVFG